MNPDLPVHPTQIYEAAAALGCAALAAWLVRRRARDGVAFSAFVMAFMAFRWMNFYLLARKDAPGIADWLYPALYAAVILTCAGVMAYRLKAR